MAEFQYWGVDKSGRKVTGKIDVANENELRMMLRGKGVRPQKISKVGWAEADLGALLRGGRAAPVKTKTLVVFTTQLYVLLSSGIPLVQAMELIVDQITDKNLKNILIAVKEKVSGGTFLYEALGAYKDVFPKIFISLIRAGESSGALDIMLKRLARYLEDTDRLNRMVKGAMTYPAIVVVASFGVVLILLNFVVPQIAEMVIKGGQELPLPTQIVLAASHVIQDNFIYIMVAVVGGGYGFAQYIKTEAGRRVLQKFMFRLPLFGDLAQKGAVARFCRTMSTLLSSGLTLLDALQICRNAIDNAVVEDSLDRVKKEIEGGKPLGAVIRKVNVFPKMAVQMISIGEMTGALDKMMDRVADYYEQEVETTVGSLTKMIEPVLMIFLGGIIAGILIAMYLPIFKMAGGV